MHPARDGAQMILQWVIHLFNVAEVHNNKTFVLEMNNIQFNMTRNNVNNHLK